jgi:hypothetical protein
MEVPVPGLIMVTPVIVEPVNDTPEAVSAA